jgi:flagellar basal-body rod protein FlgF
VPLPATPIAPGVAVAGGSTVRTERSLADAPLQAASGGVAVGGGGYLAVSWNGATYYTRAGDLTLDPEGRLSLPQGAVALGTNGAPIVLPAGTTPEIGADGTVYARAPGGGPVQVGRLRVATFADPGGLADVGGTLLAPTAASGPPVPVANPVVQAGYVWQSNVDLATALPALLIAERSFQAQAEMANVDSAMATRLDQLVG